MREKIKQLAVESFDLLSKKLDCKIPRDLVFDIEIPKNKSFGDYSLNLALKISTIAKKKPRDIALIEKEILEQLIASNPSIKQIVQRVEVAGAGFINLFLSDDMRSRILQVVEKENENFGCSQFGKGEKVLVEFVSANPTGPLTIAHGRQAVVGDTLASILKAVGYCVQREFYLNNAGRQIELLGKSVWARYQQLFGNNVPIPEDGYHGNYVTELAEKLKEKHGDRNLGKDEGVIIQEFTKIAVDTMLQNIKDDLGRLGIFFDCYYQEASLYEKGLVQSVIDKLKGHGHLFEEEGALWFRSTQFGDDKDRVLKRQTGDYTYFMADIAYHEDKFKRGFTRLINLWGPDHHGYVSRVKAACQALGYPADQVNILIVQLTTLYSKGQPVRMSKRAGEFVTLKELTGDVGADATRFFFLMRKVESHLDFDIDLAKTASQDNPVFYLQYAHARISSILRFAKRSIDPGADASCLTSDEEIALLKKISEFPDMMKQAAIFLEPHRVAEYLRELATLFHKFYDACRVVSGDETITKARLLLTDSVRIVLRNGLRILGVSQPTEM